MTKIEDVRTFGRCMSKRAYKAFLKTGILVAPKGDLVPVFVATDDTIGRLDEMNKDGRRLLFKTLGVPQPDCIVLFKTQITPLTPPQPQRAPRPKVSESGKMLKPIDTSFLIERKFVSGTKVMNSSDAFVTLEDVIGGLIGVIEN